MRRILLAALFLFTSSAFAATEVQGLLQMLDYLGVDYPVAVEDGRIIHQGEYEEMQDFAAAIGEQVDGLPQRAAKPELQRQADRLGALVADKAPPPEVADLATAMRRAILDHYEVSSVPRRPPDWEQAQALYAENCATCHGPEGHGNGEQAAELDPAPTDFHDLKRRDQRTLFGLYNTITLGVEGTAMQGFDGLSEDQRWDLAFYVAGLGTPAERLEAGRQAWEQVGERSPLAELKTVTTISPDEARAEHGRQGQALLAYLRKNPDVLFAGRPAPLAYAREKLKESLAAYRAGDQKAAYKAAVTGYLEGFELAESGLDAVAPGLRRTVEDGMTAYRNAIREGVPVAELEDRAASLMALLDRADRRLADERLSGATAFVSALVILLREGLEAILVVAALAAYLVRTSHTRGLSYLHAGWVGALAAGGLTWVVSNYLIEIGGAGRELTEGIAALVAAAVLFYVGFWLHSKTAAAQWRRFIEGSIHRALKRSTLWSLAALSFITVYREAFETILFYQALWVQTGADGKGMVVTGFGVAAAILVVLAWLILRYSARLPLRQFFGVTGLLMLLLAVIFAGKGVAALQEMGMVPTDPVAIPSFELLGVYPNLQAVGLQLALIALAVVLMIRSRRQTAG